MTWMAAFLFSVFANAQTPVSAVSVTPEPLVVTSAGLQRLCGFLANDPKKQTVCFPDLAEVPYSERATGTIQVTTGMFCTYGDDGVRCSGESYFKQLFAIPELKSVFALALPPWAGRGVAACALTHEQSGGSQAVCWGTKESVTTVPDDLKNPSAIASSGEDACALSDDGYVKCWGKHAIGNSPYGVRDLRKLVMTGSNACVVDAYGLMCWGLDGPAPTDLAADGTVIDVAMGNMQTCALTFEHQVICFGAVTDPVPELLKPIALSSFSETMCATDIDGLKCWGRRSEIPKPAPVRPVGPSRPGREIDP